MGEPTILQLTSKILPVLAHVLDPPADQVTDTTREQLVQLVKFLHGRQPTLIRSHESLWSLVTLVDD